MNEFSLMFSLSYVCARARNNYRTDSHGRVIMIDERTNVAPFVSLECS